MTPALEIIDTRIRDWKITLADTIADNASSARVVLGAEKSSPTAYDLANPCASATIADLPGPDGKVSL